MPPWIETTRDPSGRPLREEITDVVAYRESEVMFVPQKNGTLQVRFPGEVTLEKRKSDGSVENSKINSPFCLQPEAGVNITIIPPQGEKICLYWESRQ
ncbi:MAG: hypothetical protein M1575_02015 [Patescibacteria group bacterium]|nr:hypothetical protein [Patescibacteria group bacterium]MCL5095478.1 hypothetical protein [Patescibacteria group bacterium]